MYVGLSWNYRRTLGWTESLFLFWQRLGAYGVLRSDASNIASVVPRSETLLQYRQTMAVS